MHIRILLEANKPNEWALLRHCNPRIAQRSSLWLRVFLRFKQCVKGYRKTASSERLHYNDASWRRGNDSVFLHLAVNRLSATENRVITNLKKISLKNIKRNEMSLTMSFSSSKLECSTFLTFLCI